MSETLSRKDRLWAGAVLSLLVLGAAVRPVWRWLNPELAVSVAFVDGLQDPWGRPFRAGAIGGPSSQSTMAYSVGPNATDDSVAAVQAWLASGAWENLPIQGDDVGVVIISVDDGRAIAYRWIWTLPLALAGLLALPLAWRQALAPRGSPPLEALRAGLLAIPAWVLAAAPLLYLEQSGRVDPADWPGLLAPPRVAVGASVFALCLCMALIVRLRSSVGADEPVG